MPIRGGMVRFKAHEVFGLAAASSLLLDGVSSSCPRSGAMSGQGLIISGLVGILTLRTRMQGIKFLSRVQLYQMAVMQALVYASGMLHSTSGPCTSAMQQMMLSAGFWLVAGQHEVALLGMPLTVGMQLLEVLISLCTWWATSSSVSLLSALAVLAMATVCVAIPAGLIQGSIQPAKAANPHVTAILAILDSIQAQAQSSPPETPIKAARVFDSPFKSKQVNFVPSAGSPPASSEPQTSMVSLPAMLLDALSFEVNALASSTTWTLGASTMFSSAPSVLPQLQHCSSTRETHPVGGRTRVSFEQEVEVQPSVKLAPKLKAAMQPASRVNIVEAEEVDHQFHRGDSLRKSKSSDLRRCHTEGGDAAGCAEEEVLVDTATQQQQQQQQPRSILRSTSSSNRPTSASGAANWKRAASMRASDGGQLHGRSRLLQRSKSAYQYRSTETEDGNEEEDSDSSWKALDWGQDAGGLVSNTDKPHRVSLRTCLLKASSVASLSRASSVGDLSAMQAEQDDEENGAFGSEMFANAWTSVGGSVASFSMSIRQAYNRQTSVPSIHVPEGRVAEGEPTFSSRSPGAPLAVPKKQRKSLSPQLSSDEDEELEQLATALGVPDLNKSQAYDRRGSFCFQVPKVDADGEQGQQAHDHPSSTAAPACTPTGSPRMSVDEPRNSLDLTLAAYEASSLSNGSRQRSITTLRHIRSSNLLTLDNAIPEEATFRQGEVLMQQLLSNQSRMSSVTPIDRAHDTDDLDAELLGLLPKEDTHVTSSPAQSANGTTHRQGSSNLSSSDFLSIDKPNMSIQGVTALQAESSAASSQASQHESQIQDLQGSARSSLSGIAPVAAQGAQNRWSRPPAPHTWDANLSRSGKLQLSSQLSGQMTGQRSGSAGGYANRPAAGPHNTSGGGESGGQAPAGWWDPAHSRMQSTYHRAPAVNQPAMRPRLTGVAGDSIEMEVEESILLNRRMIDARKTLIEEVKIEKVLGFGSMGMVYFGTLWSARVVVKLIEHGAGLLGKEQNRGKLARQEAAVSRMLLHPNVVLTYDCCTGAIDAGRLKLSGAAAGRGNQMLRGGRQRQMTMMVQEYCDVGTLKDALKKGKLGMETTDPEYPLLIAQIALDIAQGMKYMHQLRVMHLDLKAENVLLQHFSGPQGTVKRMAHVIAKVADFGLAMVLPPDCDFHDNGIHGTVSHMPPEAMRDPVFSLATDVYSFGIVLWELVSQDKPFSGMAAHQVVEAVCDHGMRPTWPQDLPPIFEELKALACDCWETSPLHRPSFADITDRLFDILHPELRAQPSRNASSVARSETTDESDELELALRQQRKQNAAARAVMAAMMSNRGRTGDDVTSEAPASGDLVGGLGVVGEDESQDMNDGDGGSLHTLDDVLRGPPPSDLLGRMLYYLAQMPPPADQMKRVLMEPGIVRFVLPVDMGQQRQSRLHRMGSSVRLVSGRMPQDDQDQEQDTDTSSSAFAPSALAPIESQA